MNKKKSLLFPLVLGLAGISLIIIDQLSLGTTFTSLPLTYKYVIGGVLGLILLVVLIRVWRKSHPTVTTGTTAATTATTTTPPKPAKPVTPPKGELGWAFFGLFCVVLIAAGIYGLGYGVMFLLKEVQSDRPFIKNIPVVRVVSNGLAPHDWKEPPPVQKKHTPGPVRTFILEPGKIVNVGWMEMGQHWQWKTLSGQVEYRLRRTEKTDFDKVGPELAGHEWQAAWCGTFELRSSTPAKVELVIISP